MAGLAEREVAEDDATAWRWRASRAPEHECARIVGGEVGVEFPDGFLVGVPHLLPRLTQGVSADGRTAGTAGGLTSKVRLNIGERAC